MTLAEALDIVIARTKHERYRELCDPTHPDYQPAYADLVMELAGGPALRPVDQILAEARAEGIPERIEPSKPCGPCPD